MKDIKEFFDMGGYAAFVWSAYGLTFLVVGLNIYWARRLLVRSREDAKKRLITRGGEQ